MGSNQAIKKGLSQLCPQTMAAAAEALQRLLVMCGWRVSCMLPVSQQSTRVSVC